MIDTLKQQAYRLLKGFKKDEYVNGTGCLDKVGGLAKGLGSKTLIIANNPEKEWKHKILERIIGSLKEAEIDSVG